MPRQGGGVGTSTGLTFSKPGDSTVKVSVSLTLIKSESCFEDLASIWVRVLDLNSSMTLLPGFTPLMIAAMNNRAGIVKLLLERGTGGYCETALI